MQFLTLCRCIQQSKLQRIDANLEFLDYADRRRDASVQFCGLTLESEQ